MSVQHGQPGAAGDPGLDMHGRSRDVAQQVSHAAYYRAQMNQADAICFPTQGRKGLFHAVRSTFGSNSNGKAPGPARVMGYLFDTNIVSRFLRNDATEAFPALVSDVSESVLEDGAFTMPRKRQSSRWCCRRARGVGAGDASAGRDSAPRERTAVYMQLSSNALQHPVFTF
jgi:hypothetical protein